MERKKTVLIALLLLLFCVNCDNTLNFKKDSWLKEDPKIRYSEKREKEVWGKILRGYDAGLFYGTPLYDLAEELSSFYWFRSDSKIERLIKELPKESINYQEGKFGKTIGHFALTVRNLKALRLMLDRGLNPNLMDKDGDAVIININSSYIASLPDALETLRYIIKKGGNVNLYSEGTFRNPLMEASAFNLNHVKVLINAGANPHFYREIYQENINYTSYLSPLHTALMWKRISVVNYLIFNQKVDFKTLKYSNDSKFHPGEYQILHDLREMFFELDTKDYQEKMKLVAYLKTQGLDYWKTPVPERFLDYEIHKKEYLSKY